MALRKRNIALSEINSALNTELCRMKEIQRIVEVQLDRVRWSTQCLHTDIYC